MKKSTQQENYLKNFNLLTDQNVQIKAAQEVNGEGFTEDCRIRYAPHTPEERSHPLFVTALCEMEMFRYYRDLFIYGDFVERKAFIEEQAELLDRIAAIFTKSAA